MSKIPKTVRCAQVLLILNIVLCVLGVAYYVWMVSAQPTNDILKSWRADLISHCPNYDYGAAAQLSLEPIISIVASLIILFSLQKPGQGRRLPLGCLIMLIIMALFHLHLPLLLFSVILFLLSQSATKYMKLPNLSEQV